MIRLEKFALRQLIAVFALSLVMGGLLVGLFEKIVPDDNSLPLGVDVYPRWAGSQAFWRGESPYSAAVDGETQSYVFGRPALPGEDTFRFYYPAHIAIVLGPLFLLPARAAALLWTAVTWAILSILVFLIIQSMPERASPWILLLVSLSIFLQRSALMVGGNSRSHRPGHQGPPERSGRIPLGLVLGAISLILLATPHTAEYDLPALLLPFFVYAPRFLQTRIGAVIWGLLLWVPWLSWALFQMMGLTTSQWYAVYWFHYPQILVLALLAFLAVTRRMAGVVYNQTAQDIMEF